MMDQSMLDFHNIKAMLDGDDDVMVALLSTYLEDYTDSEKKISALNAAQDWHELFLFSHSLKGTLKIIGEDSVTHTLERIEHATRQGMAPEQQDLDQASSELASIQSQVQHYLVSEAI
ncbi:Hpt domain-containing protein [Vibrio rhodolitus]|uniref:Hpt domain-containing protein n=1 Tax=Vibrio rhodolitus TaxID=2231649 RepID=UPI0013DE8F77|nr:Hpt domain-containing protein [Vibrio rhodolitus]